MIRFSLFISMVGIILIGACGSPEKEPTTQPFTAEEQEKVMAAIPDQPIVSPQKPRKLLICSLAWGYKHKVAPFAAEVFKLLGKETGAFEPVISNDVALFEPEKLAQFDAILFNNTNNEIFLPENYDSLSVEEKEKADAYDELLKKSLTDFLANGKGLAVIHAGVACFRKWDEYEAIVGARFDNHPWVSGSTVTLKVEEPAHPLCRMFKTPHFEVTDEIYQMKGDYTRDKLRVLVSIDTSRTDMTLETIHRTDGDFGMAWIKKYGQGRIFYNALGHEKHIFWDPVLMRHFLAGFQYVLGDLEADARPSAEMNP